MSGGWDSKQDYDEGRGTEQLLREECERIQRDGRGLWEIGGTFAYGDERIDVRIAGLGIFRLTVEQALQLGSALLAEVEIAQRQRQGDI